MSGIKVGITKPDYSVPDGKYPAVVFQMIQIGSQLFGKNGKEWRSPQILIGFEMPTLTYENRDGEEVSNIKSATYFLSLNPSRQGVVGLREIIDGLRGSDQYSEEELNDFDITSFLGKSCMITLSGVESKGVVYQNITGVEPLSAAEAAELKPMRTPILVTIEDFPKMETLDLPDWIKDKIALSSEYQELNPGGKAPLNEQYKTPEEMDQDEIKLEEVPF